jgi:hypothetical protein
MSDLKGGSLEENSKLLEILNISSFDDFDIQKHVQEINKLMELLRQDKGTMCRLSMWRRGPRKIITKENNVQTSKKISPRYDTNLKNYIFHVRDIFKRNKIDIPKKINIELKITELLLLAISIESYIHLCLDDIEKDWLCFSKKESFNSEYEKHKKSTCNKYKKNKQCKEWKYPPTIRDLFFICSLSDRKNQNKEEDFAKIIQLVNFRNELVHIKSRKITE